MVGADPPAKGKFDNLRVSSTSNNKTRKVKEDVNVSEGKENELTPIVSALLSLKTMGEVHKGEVEQKSKAKKRKKTVLISSISSKDDESCSCSNTGHTNIKRFPHCRQHVKRSNQLPMDSSYKRQKELQIKHYRSSWVIKTIRVPATELKRADNFSWRSNGSKQLVGLSHLRRYYRCTSKGCSVHKIVDQDPSDPSMLIVSYNGEHNHKHNRMLC